MRTKPSGFFLRPPPDVIQMGEAIHAKMHEAVRHLGTKEQRLVDAELDKNPEFKEFRQSFNSRWLFLWSYHDADGRKWLKQLEDKEKAKLEESSS